MSEISQVAEKVRMLEARVETLADVAGLAILKLTALTEVAWYGRQARQPTLTAINNLLIAMDLPGEWWHARKKATLGEWWAELNVSHHQFRLDHGIGA